MKTLRYSDNQPVRKGDVFTAPRWGTCTVERFDRLNRCVVAVNLSTGETFDMLGSDTFAESDLVRRKPEGMTRSRTAAGIRHLKKLVVCLHLSGYWINRAAGTFRCYGCGCQFVAVEIPRQRGRKIETWKA